MADGDGKQGSDCGCGSGDCCSGGKGGWRGKAGLVLTIAILAAAGLVIARGLLTGEAGPAESPGSPAGESR